MLFDWMQCAGNYLVKAFLYLINQMDSLLYVLIICVCFDYISGILRAIVKRKLSSKIGAAGICRKLLIFMIIALGYLFDHAVIGHGNTLGTAITIFYICNESISVLENAVDIGLPVPDILKQAIEDTQKSGKITK